ncbi:MAG: phosphoribosylglycinamide formyltransferase [Bacteroidota bacterium]
MPVGPVKNIVLFASGSGSNVENIARYFKDDPLIHIMAVFTNNKQARVLDRCNKLNIGTLCFNRTAFYQEEHILRILVALAPDLIVLAGFLWKIPQNLVDTFPDKIINIHPALLPKYGGKGMYGVKVHEAVKANKETQTGITIHFVNANYDEGAIIHQAITPVLPTDTAASIAEKVHQLEYEHFPKVIEKLLSKT